MVRSSTAQQSNDAAQFGLSRIATCRFSSQVDLYLARWLRTANQHAACGRRLQRVRVILNRASYQGAFAGVADARTARPLHWNVAGLREFQQALESRIPRDR